ncbi:unnamed protein product, partial [marine sediment metagenome]
ELERYFESKAEIPQIRHDKKQRIETLINEEALLLARYMRGELETWIPSTRETTCEQTLIQ